ncbi:uncharacterized protein ARB_07038 [Trichophyton benhamiae CBS 112371]|uniref:Uncharacterized protein n=1 Tax=Arthroderma benhamiae (strain ATCC MYA-4681 / CBS 112371) TaxID=663331 RepID=D4AS23_ARTBC|nr:uncharacterized protein ARB_07038 [Trichophyton benhamiae CBS 112371]EFE34087.1 hypothetical protein ARB_07038 [Trichophyton benhamiae CBS 112371]
MGRGVTWDDKLDAKLLFAIISMSAPKINYDAVAKIIGNGMNIATVFPLQFFQIIQMADPLLDCTPKAIRHRLARIKLKADQGNSASSSPAKTPNSKTGGGHGMKAKKRNANDIFDEESGDIKKVKQEHVQESDTEE